MVGSRWPSFMCMDSLMLFYRTHLNNIKLEYFTSKTKQWEINKRGEHWPELSVSWSKSHQKNPLKIYQNKETIATRMDSIKSMGTESIQHKLSIHWTKGKENKSTKRIITTLQKGHIARFRWENNIVQIEHFSK